MPVPKRKLRLCKRRVETAKPDRRDYILRDDHRSVAGFGLKVAPAGKNTFEHTYRNAQGTQHWLHLGYYPPLSVEDARRQAKIYQGDVAKGLAPHEAKMLARRAGQGARVSWSIGKQRKNPGVRLN